MREIPRRRNAPLPQQSRVTDEADGKFYFKLIELATVRCCCKVARSIRRKEAGRLVAALVDAGDDAEAARALIAESATIRRCS